MSTTPKAPPTLSKAAAAWWGRIIEECGGLEDSQLWILECGLLQWDAGMRFRERIAADGEMLPDRFGQLKPHPLIPQMRDAFSGVRQTFKMLNLDLETE